MARTSNIVCTPEGLQDYACAHCLSDSQLMAALAVLLCKINVTLAGTGDCDITTMLENGSCIACMSKHQMLEGLVEIFAEYAVTLGAIDGTGDAIEAASCLVCADPRTTRAIAVGEICKLVKYWNDNTQN